MTHQCEGNQYLASEEAACRDESVRWVNECEEQGVACCNDLAAQCDKETENESCQLVAQAARLRYFAAGSNSTRMRGDPPMGALPVPSGATPPLVPGKFRLDARGSEIA